jgi:hypothetical protein
MSRNWLWAAGAFGLVLVATLVPGVGPPLLAPVAALGIGAAAAWSRRHAAYGTLGQAAGAGLVAGVGGLLASLAVFTVLGFVLGGDPAVQEFVRASEPHPEARLPYGWIAPLGAALGGFVGLGVGLANLALSAIGGLVAGMLGGARSSRSLGEMVG